MNFEMSPLTDKPTRLTDEHSEHDRTILFDGIEIGRVLRIELGPQAGLWRWASYWVPAETGTEPTLEEAISAMERTFKVEKLRGLPPRWT